MLPHFPTQSEIELVLFRTVGSTICFESEVVLVLDTTSKLEDHPLLAVFAAAYSIYLHLSSISERPLVRPQPEFAPYWVDHNPFKEELTKGDGNDTFLCLNDARRHLYWKLLFSPLGSRHKTAKGGSQSVT
jgi:hypothetical protein